jgi:aerobic carbon-monoxide dehydrogenase medium subunit
VHPFEYSAPETLAAALELLREHRDDAKLLAGGQSLVPLLNYRLARPRVVVDINSLSLADVAVADGRLRLGALVRHHQLEESPLIAEHCPVLGAAARLIGNVRVRTLGTIGGSLAHADPAAELPAVMRALDARLSLASTSRRRTVAAADFFTGPLSTALAADEMVIGIDVPAVPTHGWAVEEFARRAGDFAVVLVVALLSLDARGRIDDTRVALGGVADRPMRAAVAEDTLRGHEPTSERVAAAAAAARAALDPRSDAFVSGAYRRLLAGVLCRRALTRAVARALEAR